MAAPKSPRKGSLQFWPRKRAKKFLPRVNYTTLTNVNSKGKLVGFIAYKAGMKSAIVKDETENSMTKGKRIAVPVTILECPNMKIFSVRLYQYGIVKKEMIIDENVKADAKDLRRKLKVPKTAGRSLDNIKTEDYDNVSVIVYSKVKDANLKKTPDLSEIAVNGTSVDEKLSWVKENKNKEISVMDVIGKGDLIDTRGLTKGKGLVGPVKRFGITLKSHKSEKGRRKPGSLGPWHPARTTFMAPMAGQLGMFSRVVYNNKVIDVVKGSEKPILGIKNYGDVKTNYIIVRGSVQGVAKRQIIITPAFRGTKKQGKKKLELIELR